MMMIYLAAAVAGADNETLKTVLAVLGWVTSFAVAIIGALTIKSVKTAARAEGKSAGKEEAMQIGPQPFIVQLREEFATRRELDRVEAAMNTHIVEIKGSLATASTEMKGLFNETMKAMGEQTKATNNLIERRHKATMEDINSVASKAYEARGRIHVNLNATREELKELKAVSNVADQIGKLADALSPSQTKVQPTHHSSSQ